MTESQSFKELTKLPVGQTEQNVHPSRFEGYIAQAPSPYKAGSYVSDATAAPAKSKPKLLKGGVQEMAEVAPVKPDHNDSAKPITHDRIKPDSVLKTETAKMSAEAAESLLWDSWRQHVLQKGLAPIIQQQRHDYLQEHDEYQFPSGLRTYFAFNVNKDGSITDVQIRKSSGNKVYDQIIIDSINELAGNDVLAFLPGSHRKIVPIADNCQLSDHTSCTPDQRNDYESISKRKN